MAGPSLQGQTLLTLNADLAVQMLPLVPQTLYKEAPLGCPAIAPWPPLYQSTDSHSVLVPWEY